MSSTILSMYSIEWDYVAPLGLAIDDETFPGAYAPGYYMSSLRD